MTDDHTAQMMSCYDKRYAETPNLDRIARDGVLFTNSYVANSLSGPSRACMITGKHSHKNGFKDNENPNFDGSQQTGPKLLQQAGYQTAIVGKWHLGSTPTGFDFWQIIPGQGSRYFEKPKYQVLTNFSPYKMDSEQHPWMGYDRYQIANKMLKEASDDFDVKDCFQILEAVSQEVCPTVVSMVFDVSEMTVYWCEDMQWGKVHKKRF